MSRGSGVVDGLRTGDRLTTVHPLDELRGRGLDDHHADDALMLVHQLLGSIPRLFDGGVLAGDSWRVDRAASDRAHELEHSWNRCLRSPDHITLLPAGI